MLRLVFVDVSRDAPVGSEVNCWRDERGAVFARLVVAGDWRIIDWHDLGRFAARIDSADVLVWPAAGAPVSHVHATFRRVLLPVLYQALGDQALHASAIAGADGTVALCGPSGSGKSTVAYALSRLGWSQWADDGLVIRRTGPRFSALRLPFVPRLRPASRVHFGAEPSPSTDSGRPAFAPLAGVIVLDQNPTAGTTPSLEPIERHRAFAAMVTHAHCFDPNDRTRREAFVTDYLTLAETVPVWRLAYRPGFERLPTLIETIAPICPPVGEPLGVSS